MAKFARGNRYSQMEYQEKYKEDCRKIFEGQSKTLSSNHLTSTDNETSGDEDSDVDEMRKNLESMLEPTDTKPHVDTEDTSKKTVCQGKSYDAFELYLFECFLFIRRVIVCSGLFVPILMIMETNINVLKLYESPWLLRHTRKYVQRKIMISCR